MKFPSMIFLILLMIPNPIECSRLNNPSYANDYITQLCKKSGYYDLCMNIVFIDPRSSQTDIKGISRIVMEKDLYIAKEIQDQAQSFARDMTKTREVRSKCGKCASDYGKIVHDLIPGAMKMVDYGRYGASILDLKHVVINAKACDDQFTGKGNGTSPILNMSVSDISLLAVGIIKLI